MASLPKEPAQLKTLMHQRSSVHSRHRKALELACDAGLRADVESRVSKMAATMDDVEIMVETFLSSFDEKAEEAVKMIDWFDKLQTAHYRAIKGATEWLKGLAPKPNEGSDSGSKGGDAQLARLFNMPKVEIETFSGNCLKYHAFMKSFEVNVEKVCSDPDARLARLVASTSGSAKEAIQCTLVVGGSKGYDRAKAILKEQFGAEHLIIQEVIRDLSSRADRVMNSPEQVREFSYRLIGAREVLQEMDAMAEMDAQSTIRALAECLPKFAQNRWFEHQLKSKREKLSYLKFDDFVNFVDEVASDMTDPVCGQAARAGARQGARLKAERRHEQSLVTNDSHDSDKTRGRSRGSGRSRESKDQRPQAVMSCARCKQAHVLSRCNDFKAMSVPERIAFVAETRICANCLRSDHKVDQCLSDNRCLVCKEKHSVFLHVDRVVANGLTRSSSNAVFIPIVEVIVNGTKRIRAALDTCSTATFCTRELVEALGLQGVHTSFSLDTLNGISNQSSELVTLNISKGSEATVISGVKIVDRIPIAAPRIDVSEYPHLADIDLSANLDCDRVDLLIGQDCADALIPLAVKKGKPGEPFGVLYKFGWTLNGCISSELSNLTVVCNFVSVRTMPDLQADLSKLWALERDVEKAEMSLEEKRVIKYWDDHCVVENGHYVLPIPWKNASEPLPNNFWIAKKRLDSLSVRLRECEGLFERYDREINALLDEGYAEIVPSDSVATASRVWYLPHHHVMNPNKPNKVRIVFDCACPCKGFSLNDCVHQGPDLVNDLYSVLLRFRLHQYAIQADIKAMYHQVKVPEYDRDALRFLWVKDGELVHLRMTSHLFGGVWCSAISTYALRRTVTDARDVDPLLSHAILDCTYVDDCLVSVNGKRDALTIIHELPELLVKGGFVLTKFSANSSDLIQEIPVSHRSATIHEFSQDSMGKALGIHWNVFEDAFCFTFDSFVGELSPSFSLTRRMMLKFTASLYDPLGLVAPWVLQGKLLLQGATRLNLGWDEEVPKEVADAWFDWLVKLKTVSSVGFARCLKPSSVDVGYHELHVFCDASQVAYGCCVYLRCVGINGIVSCRLVAAKAYVAPIKQLTIPRLELQAAAKAATLLSSVRQELQLQHVVVHCWTDSMIVLGYLSNEAKQFRTFIANRIGHILSLTNSCDWRHVRSQDNPADLLSRPQSAVNMSVWEHGPHWLSVPNRFWGKAETPTREVPECDPELVRSPAVMAVVEEAVNWLDGMIESYSSWQRLYRVVAWMFVLIRRLRGNQANSPSLFASDMLKAQKLLISHVQHSCFRSEMRDPKRILKSSPIFALSPFVDHAGILRVGGRTGRHPILLPYDHRLSYLIAAHYHEISHSGVEWTLSLVREVFWITKGRRLAQKVKDDCVTCKKLFQKPAIQMMSALPPERITPDLPAFHFVGIDVFGPFHVVQRRSTVKRYGCIFTCLCCRAVHLEVVETLEADLFINALRRFTARRGTPAKIFCDNGTNFVGAEAELREAWAKHSGACGDFACRKGMEWHFNPPSAPHMGGAWERLIGVVKRVLRAILPAGIRLTDEHLSTLLCEAEAVVNGRPLTKVSDDVNDLSPLTPNMLLLMRQAEALPPGVSSANAYRSRWKFVQHLKNQFWLRFIKEYIPELNRRAKWAKSEPNFRVGELVLIVEKRVPRNLWPLARVLEVHPGRDGKVRSATLQTKSTKLKRPIVDLVRLELDVE